MVFFGDNISLIILFFIPSLFYFYTHFFFKYVIGFYFASFTVLLRRVNNLHVVVALKTVAKSDFLYVHTQHNNNKRKL